MTTKNTDTTSGILYIVATPIGNLGDITHRAIETLKKVDKVCAEDTRNTRKLLTHFGIQADLQALHDHNEQHKIAQIKNWLDAGENIALVSDAGTPLISDPGYHLVNELGAENYRIEPIPGASAIITALSIAGLPTDRFTFEGFLPAKSVGRNKALQANAKETRTQVYYESSHRIDNTVEAMHTIFGADRKVVLARELTKLYEQVFRGDLEGLLDWINADPMHQKGEFVLMVDGHEEETDSEAINSSSEELLTILLDELPVKQAAAIASKITGRKKNELYRLAMELKGK
ncbi:16S rRNA (cytidine(1402)-2'-O)-methyltransferase [uncultured Cocleimonas sp.]|uniref:16S rRNA (cytidine(1402)-2'-O)-methyltransferase n=1 Tax=uncultured Cocleimonas sp. TaxID=1051587 RepID=UPI00261D57D6|nr:16S rRNA (cytidine(1402)-2'-O)-methyltransferase [uncultured Cocleimonas sp.]